MKIFIVFFYNYFLTKTFSYDFFGMRKGYIIHNVYLKKRTCLIDLKKLLLMIELFMVYMSIHADIQLKSTFKKIQTKEGAVHTHLYLIILKTL